jgi:hypothetical protein
LAVLKGLSDESQQLHTIPNRGESLLMIYTKRKTTKKKGTYGIQPQLMELRVLALGQRQDPLSTVGIDRVLPLWLDAGLEKMVVGSRGDLVGLGDMVHDAVHFPNEEGGFNVVIFLFFSIETWRVSGIVQEEFTPKSPRQCRG